ncbi:hypothetical protein MLD38_027633 [Melastoma candidum]|uniref:Uncharacterized protein n=1 Tax=Melastoma candidum TaxID=119954 RepID=A0ACB9P2D4_9MYRT|nr:hypothetical protein MLD38_027633 [Melastoma candidum]
MSPISRLAILTTITVAIVCSLSSVKGEDTSELSHLCNLNINPDDSNQEWDISYLIAKLIDQTPTHGFSQHLEYNGYHGVAACSGQITKEDCDDCLDYANNEIFQICGFGDGEQIKLADCRLRFEHYEIPDDW